MIALAADLADVDVNDLADAEMRDAFVANFRKLEDIHRQARPYQQALEQIIERMGRGQFVAECRDCKRPIFQRDMYRSFPAKLEFICAPACGAAAPVVANGTVTLFNGHKFAKVRK